MPEIKRPDISEFKNFVLLRAISDKLLLSDIQLKEIQSNILLVNGTNKLGQKENFIFKKQRNRSPLLGDNTNNREALFYHVMADEVTFDLPRYFGRVNDFEVFSFLKKDEMEINTEQMLSPLEKLQRIGIAKQDKVMFAGEYRDKDKIIHFIDKLLIDIRRNPLLKPTADKISENMDLFVQAIDYLSQLPQVFVHGDYWRNNLIVSNGRVYIIDWENCQINNNYYDLTTLFYTEKIMFANEKFDPTINGHNDIRAMDYNFLLQTVSQIIPELAGKKGSPHDWEKNWLDAFIDIMNKYGVK
ncbi:MAG: phosphotransferase [Patescibacteria group bacterium]